LRARHIKTSIDSAPALPVASVRPAGIGRLVLVGLILWGLHLPLHDLLTYPDRISVLPNLQADADTYDRAARRFAATWSSDELPVRHSAGVDRGARASLCRHRTVCCRRQAIELRRP
jgi:hypothetical protein